MFMFAQSLSIEGRLTRKHYGFYYLSPILLLNVLLVMMHLSTSISPTLHYFWFCFSGLFLIIASIKRLHDRNKTGWWLLPMLLIPLVGWVWLIVELGFMQGCRGSNSYGRDQRTYAKSTEIA
ncbi:protein of unknown function DUF805 [Magnetococcus marinus MC-1]|uniref:DUF805 domain-containing protein n=1 Tax=Magnetococcus marinus (strain ATCC BAA-1437 / JCM 17883 / MC-1) TaxID=156889 RepID=A0L8Z7_MAGMM|nr:DUF805 domain-containing protein [Magnetococcus marinus]ABK44440.1 protein of unknown function DUF805 [Magnetococcus marinus MC-1]